MFYFPQSAIYFVILSAYIQYINQQYALSKIQ